MMDDKRNQMNFDIVSDDCPWIFYKNFARKCRPTRFTMNSADSLNDCLQKNCPIMHFIKYFAAVSMYNK